MKELIIQVVSGTIALFVFHIIWEWLGKPKIESRINPRRLNLLSWAVAALAAVSVSLVVGLIVVPPQSSTMSLPQGPSIYIVKIPRADPAGGKATHGDIAGRVEGIEDPSGYAVVVYAQTTSWYVQPESDRPLTDIGRDGQWNNWTHLGSNYAAILVRRPYEPAPVLDTLPAISGNILDINNVEGTKTR